MKSLDNKSDFDASFRAGLVNNWDAGQSTNADDAKGKAGKAGGKASPKVAANAAMVTAPASKDKAPAEAAADSLTAKGAAGGMGQPIEGGSLSLSVPPTGKAQGGGQDDDVSALATQDVHSTLSAANLAAEAVPNKPLRTDADPKIGAAQTQLARDMNDPSVTPEKLESDVKNLLAAIKDAGRADESVQLLAFAMPANTPSRNMASIYAMAAKNGVDLDSGASKLKDARTNATFNKTERAQQAAAQAAAQQAAAHQAQAYDQNAQRKPNGESGPSNWDGKTVNADGTTNDTSAAGGSDLNYNGPAANFPNDTSKWSSWDDSWNKAASQMPNSPEQTAWIKEGIEAEAAATGIDKRFILAVVMQESGGNVNVQTTNNGVNNPGLMQSHNGVSFDGSKGSVLQMIKDGVEGTPSGDGLVQGVQKTGNLFAAARLYNSGSMNTGNLSDPMGATASYCADVANRVMGRM